MCRSCGMYGHKAAECPDKKTDSDIAGEKQGRSQGKCFKCGTCGNKVKFCQKHVWRRSENSNQEVDILESEDEEPSYAWAILNETTKSENSMFCTVDGGNITYLLNILGLVTLGFHPTSPTSVLQCMIWKVSMSPFKAAVLVCRQQRRGYCIAI